MKKTIAIFTLIFALLLTTGCAASNAAPMEARTLDVQPAAETPTEAVVDEQTEAPTENEPTAISQEQALQIALDHAEVSAAKATNTKVEYDAEDGEYDVEFRYNNYEYDYSIDVITGKVLSHEKEYDGPTETKPAATEKESTKATEKATQATEKATQATEAAKTVIGKDKAKSIALNHAGISESKAASIKVEYDKEDKEYEVDFRSGDYEYEYTIDAYSGKVLSHDKEYDPVETKPKETEPKNELIGKDKAKQIALNHAGISESKAASIKVEYDKEDKEYEVDFRSGDYEYEYTIDAYSGKVLSHDKEYDPVETKPKETEPKNELIGKDKAKSIALKHAGFSADEVSGLKAEYDKDDGIPVYEVEFYKDRLEYSYEIHGETGEILSWEIDD